LRLIKLLLEDRARAHPFAGNGGSWREAGIEIIQRLISQAPPIHLNPSDDVSALVFAKLLSPRIRTTHPQINLFLAAG
jgi:hypothetical protein